MRSKLHLPVLMLSICCVAIAGGLVARKAASAPAAKDSAAPRQEVRLERRTPEYWRVTFDNPPFNIFGPETIPQLNAVITQIEKDPRVRVVVFDSAVPGFFLTHYDFIPPLSAERIELRSLGLLRACQARPLRRSAVTIARNPPAQ